VRTAAGFFAAAFAAGTIAAQAPLPRVFLLHPAALAHARQHPEPELLRLAKEAAGRALKTAPLSVMDKVPTPPSGDKHDFMSMAGYWWPNPDTPDHLPYVRRDGYRNPQTASISDEQSLHHMLNASRDLALGYYLTGDERYAQHAALLLRTWFLAPATAMHPNLNFAQYVPGKNTGRDAGIVSARTMPLALDAVGMLAGSANWTAVDDAGFKKWFADYYAWLTTSAAGKSENRKPNNHGSWYQVQVACIALYEGDPASARRTVERVRDERIPSQIDAQGMQKYEMARTKTFSYSAMNLHALVELAAIAERFGIDLYQPAKPGAPGILTAIGALMPYDPQHPWPHEQVEAGREDSLCPALVLAAAHTHDSRYIDAQKRFGCEATAMTMIEGLAGAR